MHKGKFVQEFCAKFYVTGSHKLWENKELWKWINKE